MFAQKTKKERRIAEEELKDSFDKFLKEQIAIKSFFDTVEYDKTYKQLVSENVNEKNFNKIFLDFVEQIKAFKE